MLIAIAPFLGALFALVQILETHANATSAPQQAAGMAMACAYAIVPYVFARSIEMMRASRTPEPYRPATTSEATTPNDAPSMAAPSRDPLRGVPIWVVVVGILALMLAYAMFGGQSRRAQDLERARQLDAIDKMTQ